MAKSQSDTEAERKVDATPTKAFFISMLTRDIGLIPAVVDLVDNSVDGATRLRGKRSFRQLWVRLEVSAKQLRVADNCGGIEEELARKYAFRFGRPEEAPLIKHSIGRFGVGMKRSVFKVGKKFRVESQARSSRFVLDVDVDEWARDDKAWEFEFEEVQTSMRGVAADALGTVVEVTDLHGDVAEEFQRSGFIKRLEVAIKARLQSALARGLSITLNGIPIGEQPYKVLASSGLTPAYKRLYYRDGGKAVKVKLYCGVGTSDRQMAGWHVFCNGRLVLKADKTDATGWGRKTTTRIPGFHPQYNRFRGFAYFDSDDPARLPWDTTKTRVDEDSPVYRATLPKMKRLMRPVINFLNKLKEEREGRADEEQEGPLEEILSEAPEVALDSTSTRKVFEPPKPKAKRKRSGPKMQRIQYDRPIDKVEQVKKALDVRSFKKAGEGTFDYFYEAECQD